MDGSGELAAGLVRFARWDIVYRGEPMHKTEEPDLPFRQVALDLPTPCWISDADGIIIWANTAWIDYTGLGPNDIATVGIETLHDPRIFPRVRSRWEEVKASGTAAEMVFPLRGRDGALRPFLTRVAPIRDASGTITRWFGTNTDISEQTAMETSLRESRQRLELATEAAKLGIWDWDLASNDFIYSPIAREICGFPPEGAIDYDAVVKATHREDYPRTSRMAQLALDPTVKDNPTYVYRIVRPDGSIRWVQAHGRAVFAETPEGGMRAVRYVGTLQDITDHRRLEQSVRDSEALLRSLFDVSELFIAVLEVTSDSFRYTLANRATTRFYNRPDGDANFTAEEAGIAADTIVQWRSTLLDIWTSGQPRTLEYEFDGGGGSRWYVGTYSPLPAGDGAPPRLSFVVIDVTERKLAEEHQTLLMREVDHRAKNALAVAQAIVQLTQAEDAPAFKKAVVGRMAALARAHALLASQRWESADLRKLVQDELAPYTVDEGRVVVSGQAYAVRPAIAQSIALVLHELATNSAKHGALSEPAGALTVAWTIHEDGGVVIDWRERCARPLTPPRRKGFGFGMLDMTISRQLGGRWSTDWQTDGLSCRIELPHRSATRRQGRGRRASASLSSSRTRH